MYSLRSSTSIPYLCCVMDICVFHNNQILRPLRKVENYTDLLNFSNLVNLNSLIIKRIKFIKSLRFSKLGFSEWPQF